MIPSQFIGLGIDSIEINRFEAWKNLNPNQLKKIFFPEEIDYCLKIPIKSNERLAGYFAAKEAAYKALSQILKAPIPFIACTKSIKIVKNGSNAPLLEINWKILTNNNETTDPIKSYVSITHTKTVATAIVIFSK